MQKLVAGRGPGQEGREAPAVAEEEAKGGRDLRVERTDFGSHGAEPELEEACDFGFGASGREGAWDRAPPATDDGWDKM